MMTGVLTIQAIKDVEVTQLEVTPTSVEISPYNVQKEPIDFSLFHIVGADKTPSEGFIVITVLSVNVVLDTIDLGLMSKGSYVIPKDKYPTATAIEIAAYTDSIKSAMIDSKKVTIFCSQTPIPNNRGKNWSTRFIFENGDFLEHEVNNQTNYYMWMSRVAGNTKKAPWDITATSDPEYGYWEHITERSVFATKILMARGGLIGSAAFFGDYMTSQNGISLGTNPTTGQPYTYKDFMDDLSTFIPSILLNLKKGNAHFANGNAKFNEDGSVEIIGSFSSSSEGNDRITIDPISKTMRFVNAAGLNVITIGFSQSDKNPYPFIHVRHSPDKQIIIDGTGSIRSIGFPWFELNGEGLRFVNGNKSTLYGLNRYAKIIKVPNFAITQDLTNIEFFRVDVDTSIMLPDAATNTGLSIYFKNLYGNATFFAIGHTLSLTKWSDPKLHTELSLGHGMNYIWKSDGTLWHLFLCV